ncbi:MAG: hypothetical protein AAF202_12800, partial [Pseudomonadota bacterium]
ILTQRPEIQKEPSKKSLMDLFCRAASVALLKAHRCRIDFAARENRAALFARVRAAERVQAMTFRGSVLASLTCGGAVTPLRQVDFLKLDKPLQDLQLSPVDVFHLLLEIA